MLTYILAYIGIALLFCLWDAIIGFGFEFDNNWNDGPPVWLAAVVWPLGLTITLIYSFSLLLKRLKEWRLDRAKEKRKKKREQEKIRIALKEEQETLLKQIEQELVNETENLHQTKSFR